MSRFIDERGRIFGKVNVVDILVLLVIVAVIVFAVSRMAGDAEDAVPVTVEFTVEQVRDATSDAITAELERKGAVSNDGGTLLGHIEKVSVAPTPVEYLNPVSGELERFGSPVFKNVTVVVQGKGDVSNRSVSIGGVALKVGKRVTLVGPTYEVISTVTGVAY